MEAQTHFHGAFVPSDGSLPIPVPYIAETLGGMCIPISIKMPHTDHFEPIVYGEFHSILQRIDITIAGESWELLTDYHSGLARLQNSTGHVHLIYDERPVMSQP